jgi:hypothetical protein
VDHQQHIRPRPSLALCPTLLSHFFQSVYVARIVSHHCSLVITSAWRGNTFVSSTR